MFPKFFHPNSFLRGKQCFSCFICYLFPYSYINVKLLKLFMSFIYPFINFDIVYWLSMIVIKSTNLFTFRIFYPANVIISKILLNLYLIFNYYVYIHIVSCWAKHYTVSLFHLLYKFLILI